MDEPAILYRVCTRVDPYCCTTQRSAWDLHVGAAVFDTSRMGPTIVLGSILGEVPLD